MPADFNYAMPLLSGVNGEIQYNPQYRTFYFNILGKALVTYLMI